MSTSTITFVTQIWAVGFLVGLRPSISHGNRFWKWRFQHLRRRFWPGKRANRAHFSWSPISHFGRGTQRRLPFLQDILLKICRHTPITSKNLVRTRFRRKMETPFLDETSIYIAGNLCLIFFSLSERGDTVKKSNDAPWGREERV